MKKKTVKKPNETKTETYHLLFFVVNSTPRVKKFRTTAEMGEFMDSFNKEYPEDQYELYGSWLDLAVTEVNGEVHFFTDGIGLEELD